MKVVLGLLQNLEANAHVKGLNIEKLVLTHVQVNQAQKGRRRTFRAHGRIGPYLNCPCHIEMFASEKAEDVKKEVNKQQVAKTGKKQALKVGEK